MRDMCYGCNALLCDLIYRDKCPCKVCLLKVCCLTTCDKRLDYFDEDFKKRGELECGCGAMIVSGKVSAP